MNTSGRFRSSQIWVKILAWTLPETNKNPIPMQFRKKRAVILSEDWRDSSPETEKWHQREKRGKLQQQTIATALWPHWNRNKIYIALAPTHFLCCSIDIDISRCDHASCDTTSTRLTGCAKNLVLAIMYKKRHLNFEKFFQFNVQNQKLGYFLYFR